jgi:four helix bundle protein
MRLQQPTSKLQRNFKHQAPTSKLQRSSKDQAPNSFNGSRQPVNYSAPQDGALLVNEAPEDGGTRHPFDLEERTAIFGEAIVRFSKKIPRDPTNNPLIDQLVGCGTSVGANYCEANEGVSKKDFRNIIGRCVKEAKETKHFLRMVAASEPKLSAEARELYREAKELHLIFATIFRK